MKKILFFLVFIFLIMVSHAMSYPPLKLDWSYPITAEDIYSLDLDGDGSEEFYAVSYMHKSYVNGFDQNGTPLWSTWTSGKSIISACGQVGERITLIAVGDLDNDKNLDLLVGTEVRGTKININVIYDIERELQPEFGWHKNMVKWSYRKSGPITKISVADLEGDGSKEVIFSSMDANVYVFDSNGNMKWNYELEGGVWDIFPVDIDNDNILEVIAGSYNGISAIKSGSLKWSYPTNVRIKDVMAEDLDNDGYKDVISVSDDNEIYILDNDGKFLRKFRIKDLRCLDTGDLDMDGTPEIIALSRDGISLIDNNTGWTYPIDDISLSLYATEDKLLVGCREKLYAFKVNPEYIKSQEAEEYSSMAYKYYIRNDCENAKPLAEKAKELFTELNDIDGILKSNYIILQCRPNVTKLDKRQIADEYYLKAQEYLVEGDYGNATLYAERAIDIYSEVGDNRGIIKCDMLILKIEKELKEIRRKDADYLLLEARDFYLQNDLHNATLSVERAKKIYTEIGYKIGISDCDELLSEIRRKEKEFLADNYLIKAREYYTKKDYDDSITYSEMAIDTYMEINKTEKISNCSLLIAKSKNYILADDYYKKAQNYFLEGDYENSTVFAKMAREIYLELNETEKVSVLDELISDSRMKLREYHIISILSDVFLVSIIIIPVLLILFLKRRRKK